MAVCPVGQPFAMVSAARGGNQNQKQGVMEKWGFFPHLFLIFLPDISPLFSSGSRALFWVLSTQALSGNSCDSLCTFVWLQPYFKQVKLTFIFTGLCMPFSLPVSLLPSPLSRGWLLFAGYLTISHLYQVTKAPWSTSSSALRRLGWVFPQLPCFILIDGWAVNNLSSKSLFCCCYCSFPVHWFAKIASNMLCICPVLG